MANKSSEPCIESALIRFETQLETPVVPGELTTWLQAVAQTLSALLPVLCAHIESRHRELIEDIAEQDPGLLTRVEQFKSEEAVIGV